MSFNLFPTNEVKYSCDFSYEIECSQKLVFYGYPISYINKFISLTKELVNELTIYLNIDTQEDKYPHLFEKYGVDNLLKFSEDYESSNPELFLEWFYKLNLNME